MNSLISATGLLGNPSLFFPFYHFLYLSSRTFAVASFSVIQTPILTSQLIIHTTKFTFIKCNYYHICSRKVSGSQLTTYGQYSHNLHSLPYILHWPTIQFIPKDKNPSEYVKCTVIFLCLPQVFLLT